MRRAGDTGGVAEVFTSRYLQTNAVVVDLPGGRVLVDSPYFPDELAGLPGVDRLFATHAHFDHLLGRLAFPGAPLLAARDTAGALPGTAARELAAEDARRYVARDRALDLTGAEGVDGLDGTELIPTAPGHTGDGCAVWIEDEALLIAGDHLSDVEIPLLSWAGSLDGYRAALDRLEPYVRRARLVVPGHGSPADGAAALARLEEDRRYLSDWRVPASRSTVRQHEIHAANLERHGP